MNILPSDNRAFFDRIHAEYAEMPGMSLTLDQVARLCGIERSVCKTVLDALVDGKFLCLKHNGAYARRTEEAGHTRMAKAQLHDYVPRVGRRAS